MYYLIEKFFDFDYIVIEIEIKKGILEVKCLDKIVVVFERKIQGFINYDDGMIKRYIDIFVENGKVIYKINNLQVKIKDQYIGVN